MGRVHERADGSQHVAVYVVREKTEENAMVKS